MPNPGSAPYTSEYNGRAYPNPNSNYQASYTIVAYTNPIPLLSCSLDFLPNHAYQNTQRFNTYGQPEANGFGFETLPQFPFRPKPIDMTPPRATVEPGVDPNNLTNDTLKLRIFPLSLSGTAFTWFTSLAPNSIFTWAQLEQKFHEYFYSGDTKLRLLHLTTIKQKHSEPVTNYIRRFRDTRNRRLNLNISDKDLANLAYLGLIPHLKEKLESMSFLMLARSCSGLWIVKVEPKGLETLLGVVKSLGTSVMLMRLSMVASHLTMKRPTCV
jgi:hypothetical protein